VGVGVGEGGCGCMGGCMVGVWCVCGVYMCVTIVSVAMLTLESTL